MFLKSIYESPVSLTKNLLRQSVEKKVCTGTERQEINSSTEDEENKPVGKGNTVPGSLINMNQAQDAESYDKDSTKEACAEIQVEEKDQEVLARPNHGKDRV